MKKAIITVDDIISTNDAGPKAKEDFDFFAEKQGFEIIHQHFDVHSKLKKLLWSIFTAPSLLKNEQYDEVIFQYPTYSLFMMKRIVPQLKKKTKKLYFIIHDIESIRMSLNDLNYWKAEKNLLNMADGLIVHTESMSQWLKKQGVNGKIVCLNIFDYKNLQSINYDLNYNQTVCFAGNLNKSTFLEHLSLSQGKMSIYGINPAPVYPKGLTYKGSYNPDELPAHLNANFGLVWDGTSTDTCDGAYGNYLKYNAPHKTSLYLSSGIPVLIWENAALSSFIKENNVGITVSNLNELNSILNNMSSEDYKVLKRNAIKMSLKLRQGHYTKIAINKLED